MKIRFLLPAGLIAAAAGAAVAAALPDPRSISIPRIAAQVAIDGALDERVWQNAARVTGFVQHDTMTPARVRTEVRVWYDEAALYLGWTCEDPDIQATFTSRDSRFWDEEVVEFFVTPAPLARYFEFEWNPLGSTFDAIIANTLGPDGQSQGIKGDWSYTAAAMTYAAHADGTVQNSGDLDRGWSVEVRLPFADIGTTPNRGDVWRGNFYRFNRDRDRPVEQLSWSPTVWPGFHQPARFGYLRFD